MIADMSPRPAVVRLDLHPPEQELARFMSRFTGQTHCPELVTKDTVRIPAVFKRFQNSPERDAFREEIDRCLFEQWSRAFGPADAEKALQLFRSLDSDLTRLGAVIFANLITRRTFYTLVAAYDHLMGNYGACLPFHSYVDLQDHPSFLTDQTYNEAFLHPLAVTLIARRIGEPVRVVDARCKDTTPMRTRAQDNVLHIDDTPFNREFKILLSWQKSAVTGPNGQNMVFLPGTNQGTRNCFWSDRYGAWWNENGSVFTTTESVERLFAFQGKILGVLHPRLIEVKDNARPLSTVFEAGSLVHHRYRTNKGFARSCVIIAFHSSLADPGGLLEIADLHDPHDLNGVLLGHHDALKTPAFLDALMRKASIIGEKLLDLTNANAGTFVVDQDALQMPSEEVREWYAAVTTAPPMDHPALTTINPTIGETMSVRKFVTLLGRSLMLQDKLAPLDLILYSDNREQIRKLARRRIREMRAQEMEARLLTWVGEIGQPCWQDVLVPEKLAEVAGALTHLIETVSLYGTDPMLVDGRRADMELTSLRQLASDLGEAMGRCHSLQTFCSTSLFLFWSCDAFFQLKANQPNSLMDMGGTLLRHYIATAILVRKLNPL